jgi:hypothetical protein
MISRRRRLVSVLFIVVGIISAAFVAIMTNPDTTIPGLDVGYDIEVDGNYAYVSNNYGVSVVDMSVHNAPLRVASIQVNSGVFGLDIVGDILYVGGTSDGLVIVDISNPTNPEVIGNYTEGGILSLFVSNNHVFAHRGGGMLEIIDVSDPSNPSTLSTLNVGTSGHDIAVVGDICYFADPSNGLIVVDVSDLSSPEIIRTVPSTGSAFDICIYEDILYLGRHGSGLRIYDISTPEDPSFLSYFNDGGEVYGVSGNGEYLVLADLQEGAELLNVTDPRNPVEIAEYTNAAPHNVYYDGTYAYLADQDKEFILIDFEGEEVQGYAVRSPSVDFLWTIPIGFILSGVLIIAIPFVRKDEE